MQLIFIGDWRQLAENLIPAAVCDNTVALVSHQPTLFTDLARRKRILWFLYHDLSGVLGKQLFRFESKIKSFCSSSNSAKMQLIGIPLPWLTRSLHIRLKLDRFQPSMLFSSLSSSLQVQTQMSVLSCKSVIVWMFALGSHLSQFLHPCEVVRVLTLLNANDLHLWQVL